jgi:acetyltransferase
MGGVMVEVFRDLAYGLAPLTPDDVERMLKKLKSHVLLTGFRGKPRMELRPFIDLVVRVSEIAWRHRDEISELELNPVIVHEQGSGLTIVDALLRCHVHEQTQGRHGEQPQATA